MADFDSVNKRYSGFGWGLDFMRVRPEPDNDIGTQDRLHYMPLYAGIAAGLPTSSGSGSDHKKRPHIPKWSKRTQFELLYRRSSS